MGIARYPRAISLVAVVLFVVAFARIARGQEAEPLPPTPAPEDGSRDPPTEPGRGPDAIATEPAPAPPPPPPTSTTKITPTGYVEAHYAYNFNRPSNGITNFRGFDNRHDSFTITNAALGVLYDTGPVFGRVVFQIGSTPGTAYLSEPSLAGAPGANGSNAELWRYLQEANVGYHAPVGRGLDLQAGIVPSTIGLEVLPIHDNWNWSRSNLFFGLPFYHTGVRARYEWTDNLSTTIGVFNGWNTIVDNNEAKSVQINARYKVVGTFRVRALYFGGIERARGAPEGPWWRHHFDLLGTVDATSWLSLAAQADYGFEPNRIGSARWWAGAAYARFQLCKCFYVSLRGDRFTEHLATDAPGARTSTPLFFGGSEWVSSGTVTLDARPHEAISVRLEYRHDASEAPLFFRGDVHGDGSTATPFLANARSQDTLLLGATAWF